MLDLDSTAKPAESTANSATDTDAQANATAHGTVEPCQFEELLERAMEIVRARRAGVGSRSS